jgi:membrane protease subunit (stomatin/prohibitin family)
MYTNDPSKGRITRIQQDSIGFARSLAAAVEQNYQWSSARGLTIVATAIISIEYDEMTRELLRNVQRADALAGQRGNSNLQASVAEGFEAAGQNAGPGGIIGMGMAGGAVGLGGLQQPTAPPAPPAPAAAPPAEDPVAKLQQYKQMLDAGLITQADYDAAKAKALGL